MTTSEAKTFFIERVVAHARREGAPLSEREQSLLRASESDPDSSEGVFDLESEAAEQALEKRVADLLTRAYRADTRANPQARRLYSQAYATLATGDHYLLIILDQAFGERLLPRSGLRRLGMFVLLFVPGVLALLIAAAALWSSLFLEPWSARSPDVVVFGAMLLLGGVFMFRLWWRKG